MTKEKPLADRLILLVEDEMMVAMLLESALEAAGSVVVPAGHLEQALRLAADCNVDAAVLDVNLHGKHSYPVADKLIERGIPFVFSTGYGDVDLIKLYPNRPVLAKPYRPAELISVLVSILGTEGSAGGKPTPSI